MFSYFFIHFREYINARVVKRENSGGYKCTQYYNNLKTMH